MEQLSRIFQSFDTNLDGKISVQELKNNVADVMDATDMTEAQIDSIYAEIDTNGSGEITFSEFVTSSMNHYMQLSDENLELAFKTLSNENDQITPQQLKVAFDYTRDKSDFDSEEAIWDKLIEECDANDDGAMDYNEFMHVMKKAIKF